MTLKERITEDMKAAMRAGEKEKLATIRLILAAVKQIEVDERIVLDEARMLAVLEKLTKQRKESIAQFEAGGRPDLVAKEVAELAVIQAYLPAQMSDAELDALIAEAIATTGAASVGKDMGKVMGIVKGQGRLAVRTWPPSAPASSRSSARLPKEVFHARGTRLRHCRTAGPGRPHLHCHRQTPRRRAAHDPQAP